MDIAAWREETYKKMFDSTVTFVNNLRKGKDPFTIEDLEAMLQSEYDRQGLAWDGRGEVMEINIEATIAALQQELSKWRKERKSPTSSFSASGRWKPTEGTFSPKP